MTESGLTLLKNIGDKIETSTYNGILNLQDPLLLLLITLAIIGVCSEFDMFFNSTWNWGNIFTKIIHIGFLAFLIKNWDNLLKIVKNSGQTLGMAAGGVDVTFTPTYLLASTCSKVYLAFENLWKNFPGVMSGTIMVHILATIALCVALLALFRIAFVIFMANAEFLILGSLSMVLLPFGVTRWTSSICEKHGAFFSLVLLS